MSDDANDEDDNKAMITELDSLYNEFGEIVTKFFTLGYSK